MAQNLLILTFFVSVWNDDLLVAVCLCVFYFVQHESKQNFIMMLLASHFEWKIRPRHISFTAGLSNELDNSNNKHQTRCRANSCKHFAPSFFFLTRLLKPRHCLWLFTFMVTKSHNLWNNDQKLYQHYSIVMPLLCDACVFFGG